MANMTFKTNILPSTNLGYSLGSSDQKWTVYGAFKGNADTATKISSTPNNTNTFLRGDNTWSANLEGNFTTSKGSIWAGTNGDTTAERDIGVRAGGGQIYLYSSASATGGKGLYISAHGAGNGKTVIGVDNDNNVTFYGTLSGNASTATKLSNTPNNTYSFLRGDNTWSDTMVGSAPYFTIKTNNDSNYAVLRFATNNSSEAAVLFLNAPSRSGDGGASTLTLRNNVGNIRINSNTYATGLLTVGQPSINSSYTFHVNGTSSSGALHLRPAATSFGEGIRIHAASNNWVTLALCGTDNTGDTGTSANTWSLHNYAGTFYINKNNSSGANNSRAMATGTGWTFGNTSRNSYALNTASFICDSWVRTCGSTGWYNESYGGGWYMEDSTWIRTYNSKSVYAGSGCIRSDSVRGGSGIAGSHDAAFEVRAARSGSYGSWLQGWFSGYTQGGAWSLGNLCSENLVFTYGTHANYNSNTNNVVYIQFGSGGQVYGAVWNDYAEYRNVPEAQKNCSKANAEQTPNELAGRCVCEVGDDTMVLSSSRLQKGCKIISDTFGFAIGETDECKTPIAVSGRVLVFPYENKNEFRNHIGDAVCSGPNGTVSIMTDKEVKKYPLSIIGTISAIPEYKEWGTNHILVNGRIWIYVR